VAVSETEAGEGTGEGRAREREFLLTSSISVLDPVAVPVGRAVAMCEGDDCCCESCLCEKPVLGGEEEES
jgi:hypothetical protein